MTLGTTFEAEIREQPAVWRRIAASDAAARLAASLGEADVLFAGSGSSLFVAMLGALAFRRRGVRAAALAATEARFDAVAYRDATVVALSQSGRSSDLLAALDLLAPRRLIALTNDVESPLAARANVVVDALAGPERAVPASKSVTAMMAIVLWAAALRAGRRNRSAAALEATADGVEEWLYGDGFAAARSAAAGLAGRRGVAVVGAGYGVPIALEFALKVKEASYVHAEGFAAGEFRHGASAVLDPSMAIVGIVDDASRDVVRRPLADAAVAGAARYVVGEPLDDVLPLGARVDDAFNTLAWTATAQTIALELGRARGIDSDTPRGLRKAIV